MCRKKFWYSIITIMLFLNLLMMACFAIDEKTTFESDSHECEITSTRFKGYYVLTIEANSNWYSFTIFGKGNDVSDR